MLYCKKSQLLLWHHQYRYNTVVQVLTHLFLEYVVIDVVA